MKLYIQLQNLQVYMCVCEGRGWEPKILYVSIWEMSQKTKLEKEISELLQ